MFDFVIVSVNIAVLNMSVLFGVLYDMLNLLVCQLCTYIACIVDVRVTVSRFCIFVYS